MNEAVFPISSAFVGSEKLTASNSNARRPLGVTDDEKKAKREANNIIESKMNFKLTNSANNICLGGEAIHVPSPKFLLTSRSGVMALVSRYAWACVAVEAIAEAHFLVAVGPLVVGLER